MSTSDTREQQMPQHGRSAHPRGRTAKAIRVATVAVVLAAAVGCTATDSSPGAAPPSSVTTAPASVEAESVAAEPAGSAADIQAEVQRQLDAALTVNSRYEELVKSVIVSVDGATIYERYSADSGPDVTHNGYSVTKSVMSMLIGIAIDEGLIAGVDQTLAQLLPNDVPIMAPGVAEVTLEQVLTMTAGVVSDQIAPPNQIDTPDMVTNFLSTPLEHAPGTGFDYSSRSSHLLSAILVQATGRSVLDYARAKLFDPLGITTEPAAEPVLLAADLPAYDIAPGFGWSKDEQSFQLGFSDLRITAPDMVSLGQLYLGGGQWNGRQLVSADWVTQSTHDRLPDSDTTFADNEGYGYQWWVLDAAEHPAFAAIGHAGQMIEVVPDLNLVVAVSSLDDNSGFDPFSFASLVETSVIPVLEG